MRTNLSSQISLNRVSPRYYRPGNAVERSVLTRLEKSRPTSSKQAKKVWYRLPMKSSQNTGQTA